MRGKLVAYGVIGVLAWLFAGGAAAVAMVAWFVLVDAAFAVADCWARARRRRQ